MGIFVLDAFCALLVVIGAIMVLKRPAKRSGAVNSFDHPDDNPRTYAYRIVGSMIAVFGFALGLMATVYHFA